MIDHRGTIVNFLMIIFLICMDLCKIPCTSGDSEIQEVRCMAEERRALLRLKKGLIDDYGVLSSWGDLECCRWRGVHCSNTTGHVIALKLRSPVSKDYGFVHSLKGKITPALLDLHYLKKLDMSGNDFGGNRIPEFIGSVKSLEHLNLYDCNFSGIIPPHLGNLTNLRTLDLSRNYLSPGNLNWFSNLSLLSVLDSSYINLNGSNWFQQMPNLRSMQELWLRGCHLSDITPSARLFVNFSTVSFLELSDNEFTSSTVDWLFNTSLFTTYPRTLSIFANKLDRLPPNLGQLSKLVNLYVAYNSIGGTVSESDLEKLHNLKGLVLSYNSLNLNISPGWNPPFQLSRLDLALLNQGPYFPKWIQTQSHLTWLDLSCSGISDEAPKWLWGLSPSLQYLNLSDNQITGTIHHFSFSSISILDVSYNNISGSVPLFPPYASYIHLSTNDFSGQISSICTHQQLPDLVFLDLSNNQLTGKLPTCWENMTSLMYLDLSNNGFSGDIPYSLGSLKNLKILQLHDNNFSGYLPLTLKNCRNLQFIDVGQNKLTGNVPRWIGVYGDMTHLIFRRNGFYGTIPLEMCSLIQIQVLDLSENNISGNIPDCFDNFISLVGKNNSASLDVGISYFYAFHSSNGHLYEEWFSEYALVQWKGKELEYRNTLGLLKLIDLSSNKLVGNIPKAFSSLKGLISLNLSRNSLTGSLDSNIGDMEMLECLDLSSNQLSGETEWLGTTALSCSS